MSYTRFSEDSDVYVFASAEGGWECMLCGNFKNLLSLRQHLLKHQKRGDKVPQRCFDRIDSEIEEKKYGAFKKLIRRSRRYAKEVGLKKSDVKKAIKKVRFENRLDNKLLALKFSLKSQIPSHP